MKFVSLFAGIGGLDLGLERAGMKCVGQVEIDPYCRAALAKHWPGVKRMEDVRLVRGDEFGRVDLVCGGVPCQPASCAGKRKGADDDRWLWPEFIRIVRACGPAWFVAENVRGFLSLPASAGVVRDLERAGYEVRTLLLGAHHVGAPHRRDRIWIVGRLGDAAGVRRARAGGGPANHERADSDPRRGLGVGEPADAGAAMAHAPRGGLGADGCAPGDSGHADQCGKRVADAQGPRREGAESAGPARAGGRPDDGGPRWPARPGEPRHEWEAPRLVYTAGKSRGGGDAITRGQAQGGVAAERTGEGRECDGGEPEPGLGQPASGLPRRLAGFARRNALKALGNAVVPQVAEVIGRAILQAET